jgi:hypothetical protein
VKRRLEPSPNIWRFGMTTAGAQSPASAQDNQVSDQAGRWPPAGFLIDVNQRF